jgi:spermidine synthase
MSENKNNRHVFVIFGITIFLSAFLLFQIQLIISKYLLPWFGGTASIWTVCMLFFQIILLLGYLYSHLITKYLTITMQVIVHVILLVFGFFSLNIFPDESWKMAIDSSNPTFYVLLILLLFVGLPAVILSSTSPLLQSWISKVKRNKSPYKLYALSNLGSLLGLFLFPFIFEPLFGLQNLKIIWSVLFSLFCVCCGFCLYYIIRGCKDGIKMEKTDLPQVSSAPRLKEKVNWLLLSASTCVLFIVITNKISQDIAVVPFLWVAPLFLYLLSFVIVFSRSNIISKRLPGKFMYIVVPVFISLYFLAVLEEVALGIFIQITLCLSVLFFFSLICHTELVRTKPNRDFLTDFYLMIAVGGVLGGIFTGLIFPMIFTDYFELPIILFVCAFICIQIYYKINHNTHHKKHELVTKSKEGLLLHKIMTGLFVVFVIFGISVFSSYLIDLYAGNIASSRSFYGVLKIRNYNNSNPEIQFKAMINGGIVHGFQFVDKNKSSFPTAYYCKESGVGIAFQALDERKGLKIVSIGLGVGTVAVYGKRGDEINFYEINRDVEKLGREHFSYLDDSLAEIKVIVGDARISLENEKETNFDLIILDAFSSDSIPVHLLTKEAFSVYLAHLKSDGIIAVHTSNRYLNLDPVILNIADYYKLNPLIINSDETNFCFDATWILLSPQFDFEIINDFDKYRKVNNYKINGRLWTDDYSNLLQAL